MKSRKGQRNIAFAIVFGLSLLVSFSSCKKDDPVVVPVPDASIYDTSGTVITCKDAGQGTGTVTWTSNYTYLLDGYVFVNSGQTLTIEAGTVIKGKAGTGENASALIVARGATINAIGTATDPIIFTAQADDLMGSVPVLQRGLWGGLIVLGNAKLNSTPGETAIEGIPTTETRAIYGGSNDADNSGTIKYVSIRHGGSDIGEGNEINGLTLGGVGSGTTIEYVEVIANADDGVEFFGGAPQLKNIVTAFCGDDNFDYDEGFHGKGQFWFVIQDPAAGDRVGEHDGGTDPEDGTPYAEPKIYNVTYIGRGEAAGVRMLTFRDNAGGHYINSIFVNQSKGIDIEMLASGEDSYKRYKAGHLTIENCLFYDIKANSSTGTDMFDVSFGSGATANPDSATAKATFKAEFVNWNNEIANPGLQYASPTTANGLNPVPTGTVTNNVATPSDSWFTTTSYKGAFAPGASNWAAGWTLLSSSGIMQ
ncbi:MAG: hypothetical protein K9J13_10640 [Saprospiraceae bacterium]|nr:hypothetical protein [Saprospiraceae bacterium]